MHMSCFYFKRTSVCFKFKKSEDQRERVQNQKQSTNDRISLRDGSHDDERVYSDISAVKLTPEVQQEFPSQYLFLNASTTVT